MFFLTSSGVHQFTARCLPGQVLLHIHGKHVIGVQLNLPYILTLHPLQPLPRISHPIPNFMGIDHWSRSWNIIIHSGYPNSTTCAFLLPRTDQGVSSGQSCVSLGSAPGWLVNLGRWRTRKRMEEVEGAVGETTRLSKSQERLRIWFMSSIYS